MPRVTVNINHQLSNKLLKIAKDRNESLSKIIKQFIEAGFYNIENNSPNINRDKIDIYCQKLSIQTNALLRQISMKLLDLTIEDLEIFKEASQIKYNQISEDINS
jgi:hypothetical protein